MTVRSHSHRRLTFGRAAWCLLALCVAIGELLPTTSAPVHTTLAVTHSHRNAHLLAYTLLASWPWLYERRKTALTFGAVAFSLGVALEFAQQLTPDRRFRLQDMAANGAGVAIGIFLGALASALWSRIARD